MKPLAAYEYYLHGPLKRSVLGNQLQGLDYVYTIDGKLKAVNNPVNSATGSDPGLDGYSTGPHATVSPDAFGYALEYYPGDYARSGSPIRSYTNADAYAHNLSYTGLVKAQSWRTVLPAAATNAYSTGLMYEYQYDELYRLKGATFGTITETTPTVGNPMWSNTFTQKPEYKLENISYDQNGNLQSLKRYAAPINSSSAHLLDNLTYSYDSAKKNKLKQVGDAASNTAGYSADLDLPNQSNSSNYVYNNIGELIENKQEGLGYEYNSAGLITRVYSLSTSNSITEYTYNDKGLKYSKTSYSGGIANIETEQLFYVYDAGGAEVATYKKLVQIPSDVYALQHHSLYGAGRVGLLDKSTGKALFELSDHVGNVRAVVADNGSGVAETVSYTDYYPHGGTLPGRTYQSSLNFPYGYQGQEKDGATGLTNFELRQYDPRIGRWYNPDPYGQHHSPYLAMSNNPVSNIDPDGGWDYGDGANVQNSVQQSMQGTVDWMRMTPSERREYQAANGTDYAGQFRDRVFDMAFLGGYEDQEGNNWYYSARKNDIGAWMKMNSTDDPFGYYKIASGNGQFKMASSWLNYTERFVGLGYNGEVERMKWAQKTYGGTGDGSILDQLHQSFSSFNTKWNPIAHLVNGIDGVVFGTDRFGNQQSGMQTAIQLASGVTGVFGEGIANGIVSKLGSLEFNAAINGSSGALNEILSPIGCFVKGTKVWCENGLVNIENVVSGDMVFAYDIKADKVVSKVVSKAYERKIKGLIKLEYGNEIIYTTSEHPFYVNKNWIEASKLKTGDLLFLHDKTTLPVVKITVIDTIVKVYNFTVEDEHNYFVGQKKVLVHNSNPCQQVPAFSISAHAIQQAITRGFKPADIMKIINQGTKTLGKSKFGNPQWRYMSNGNTVIVDATKNRVITIFSDIKGTTNGSGAGTIRPFK